MKRDERLFHSTKKTYVVKFRDPSVPRRFPLELCRMLHIKHRFGAARLG